MRTGRTLPRDDCWASWATTSARGLLRSCAGTDQFRSYGFDGRGYHDTPLIANCLNHFVNCRNQNVRTRSRYLPIRLIASFGNGGGKFPPRRFMFFSSRFICTVCSGSSGRWNSGITLKSEHKREQVASSGGFLKNNSIALLRCTVLEQADRAIGIGVLQHRGYVLGRILS